MQTSQLGLDCQRCLTTNMCHLPSYTKLFSDHFLGIILPPVHLNLGWVGRPTDCYGDI